MNLRHCFFHAATFGVVCAWLAHAGTVRAESNLGPEATAASASKATAATPSDEARRRFEHGVSLYQEGDLKGSLVEFKAAYRRDPVYRVLYNLGLVSHELHDWAGALGYYRRYLSEGGERIPAERRALIEHNLAEIDHQAGRIEVTAPPGAEVTIDDAVVDATALRAPIYVNPGQHRLRVSQARRPPQLRTIEVTGGARTQVSFAGTSETTAEDRAGTRDAEKSASEEAEENPTEHAKAASRDAEEMLDEAAEEPPTAKRKKDRESGTGMSAATYTWTAAGTLIVAAAITGYFARQASEQLIADRNVYPANPATLLADQSKTQHLALTADALGAAGVACALVSIYLSFGRDEDEGKRPLHHAAAPPAHGAVPLFVAGGAGLAYHGRF